MWSIYLRTERLFEDYDVQEVPLKTSNELKSSKPEIRVHVREKIIGRRDYQTKNILDTTLLTYFLITNSYRQTI